MDWWAQLSELPTDAVRTANFAIFCDVQSISCSVDCDNCQPHSTAHVSGAVVALFVGPAAAYVCRQPSGEARILPR